MRLVSLTRLHYLTTAALLLTSNPSELASISKDNAELRVSFEGQFRSFPDLRRASQAYPLLTTPLGLCSRTKTDTTDLTA